MERVVGAGVFQTERTVLGVKKAGLERGVCVVIVLERGVCDVIVV